MGQYHSPGIKKTWAILLLITIFIVASGGCTLSQKAVSEATAPYGTDTPTAPLSNPDDWQAATPGVWTRNFRVEPPYTSAAFDMPAVRLDPALISLRVHYKPTFFLTIPEWLDQLDDPLVVVNGSFFTAEGYAVGLVVADGSYHGNSLEGFGGMLQVSAGETRVRSLVREPYADELYEQVAQGFPMFIHPGGEAARTGEGFDDPSRRTMIAQDMDGYIYLFVTPLGRLTLRQAQQWLLESEFNFDVAFGLDGGKSTGLYVKNPAGDLLYPSIDPIPVVIAAYPR